MGKDEFIQRVQARYFTIRARLRFFAAYLAAIGVSFYVVFMQGGHVASLIHEWITFRVFDLAISGVVATALAALFLGSIWVTFWLVGTSGGGHFHVALFRSHRFFPMTMLLRVYVGIGISAIFLYAFGAEFVVRGNVGPISLIDSIYFAASTITTIGQNDISPHSIPALLTTLVLYGVTLLVVIFVFQRVAEHVSFTVNRNGINELVGSAYEIATECFLKHNLDPACQRKVLEFLADRFDFGNPGGLWPVKLKMDAGNFKFASC